MTVIADLHGVEKEIERLLEQVQDMADRLSVHKRDGVTVDYDQLRAELGLDD